LRSYIDTNELFDRQQEQHQQVPETEKEGQRDEGEIMRQGRKAKGAEKALERECVREREIYRGHDKETGYGRGRTREGKREKKKDK